VRDSFYVPLASRLSMHGVELDAITAQIEAGRWLREVANVRVHGTTGQRPVDLWPEDRAALRPWPGRAAHLQQHRQARYPAVPPQHDLRQYDQLLQGVPT
jgi:hypothetical protein